MLHLCPIQSGFDIISTPGGVVNGFLSILQRKPLAFSFLWGSQTFDHFSGADQRPSRGRSRPKAPPESGVDRLTVPVSGLPAWWGRFPLGVPFDWPKGTKSHQRGPPLWKPQCFYVVLCGGAVVAPGPGGVTKVDGSPPGTSILRGKAVGYLPGPQAWQYVAASRPLGAEWTRRG